MAFFFTTNNLKKKIRFLIKIQTDSTTDLLYFKNFNVTPNQHWSLI